MPYVKTRSRVWLKWWLDSLKWSHLQGWMWWLGGCSVSLTLRPRTAAILYSMSKLMFIPYFWSLFFLINLSNFYLYSIRLTFFYYTYICFYECMNLPFWDSTFCSELWPQLGFFFYSVSHYSYFYTGVCSEKGHIWDALAQSLFSLSISSFC